MSIQKFLALVSVFLFGTILVLSVFKKENGDLSQSNSHENSIETIQIDMSDLEDDDEAPPVPQEKAELSEAPQAPSSLPAVTLERESPAQEDDLPEADRISELFNKKDPRLPIVETIVYKSRVPWHKGKPAWVADYASHYKTSRHFIARGLNNGPDYEKQDVKEGDRFNVFRNDIDFDFYLVIDLLSSKMWLYYVDHDHNERVLLKTYRVGLGRADPSKASGYLTPTGKYSVGSKVAVYKPNMKGVYQGDKIEMVRVFGTRWLPFGEEIADTTEPAKGFGIHGLPLLPQPNGELKENLDTLGKYESDGCIRMATKDVEELFSIIITRPTTVEIVKGFHKAKPPGIEKKIARG